MIRWLLFVHIVSVAFWLGSIGALIVLHRKGKSLGESAESAVVYQTTRSVVRWIMNPSSVLVLLTGVTMLVQMGLGGKPKPFWLGFMEQFGGMVALISVALLTWQTRKIDRAPSPAVRSQQLRRLNQMMAGVAMGVTATIFVVILRLG